MYKKKLGILTKAKTYRFSGGREKNSSMETDRKILSQKILGIFTKAKAYRFSGGREKKQYEGSWNVNNESSFHSALLKKKIDFSGNDMVREQCLTKRRLLRKPSGITLHNRSWVGALVRCDEINSTTFGIVTLKK